MTSILFLLSLFFDVRGVVLDPMGRVVEGAQVSCGPASASTDASGTFTIPGAQKCESKVTKEGFAPRTVSLDPDQENRVTLELPTRSEEILVSATKAPISIEEAGVSASIFVSKDLEVRQYAPVQDLLRDVAGVTVVQTGSNGGVTSVFSRGGESNSTLVLLDGIPVTDPGGALNFTFLTTPGLERVEVVRGPESALYGAEAASGVIQLFTAHGDPEATIPHGSLSYERGSFSTDHWTAALNGGLANRFDYALTTDQYRSTSQFPNNVFRNTTGTANVGFKLSEATSLRAIYRGFDAYTGVPGTTFYNAYNFDGREFDRDSSVSLRLDDTRGPHFSQRAYYAYHRLRSQNEDENLEIYDRAALVSFAPSLRPGTPGRTYLAGIVPAGTPGSIPETIYNFNGGFESFTNRHSANYQATVTHPGGNFVFGYTFEHQAGIFSGENVSRQNNGFTLYDQYAFGRRIFLSGGARIEHSSIYGNKFAPRGAVTFLLPTETYLRLSLARGIKEPSLLETNSPDPTFPGNRRLRPERTDSFEAGLTREWFGRRVRTEISYFRNRYTNRIEFQVTDPQTFVGTWFNIGRSYSHGVELSGVARITSFATIHAGYTRLYTRIVTADSGNQGEELARRPAHSGSLSLELTPKRWNFMIGSRFVGERRDVFAAFGVNRLSAYQYAFLSGSFQINRHVTPFIRVNNLSNEIYQEVAGFGQWSRNASGGVRLTW